MGDHHVAVCNVGDHHMGVGDHHMGVGDHQGHEDKLTKQRQPFLGPSPSLVH